MRNKVPDNVISEGRVSFIYYEQPSRYYYCHDDRHMPKFNDLADYCRKNFKGYVYYIEYPCRNRWVLEFFFKNVSDAIAFKLGHSE